MYGKRVVVAMSGGVDSSVAAALLKKEGYEVVGMTMDLFAFPGGSCPEEMTRSCCGRSAQADAARVSACLGIPHYVVNMRKVFATRVIDEFCREYARGRTPNPCILCNTHVKFRALWRKARRMGADYLATGHHARIRYDRALRRRLLFKGRDKGKDQSYFLYPMTRDQLDRTLMPVGELTKEEVRNLAGDLGLPVQNRPESQEICFIPDRDYVGFLKRRIPGAFRPGFIVDCEGRVLARHGGIPAFTVGQRRGMGVSAPHPLYVLEIRAARDTVVVGPGERLFKRGLLLSDVHLLVVPDSTAPRPLKAKLRYKHREAPAVLQLLEGKKARLEFQEPQRAPTPGQSAVFYEGEMVMGGGIIVRAED